MDTIPAFSFAEFGGCALTMGNHGNPAPDRTGPRLIPVQVTDSCYHLQILPRSRPNYKTATLLHDRSSSPFALGPVRGRTGFGTKSNFLGFYQAAD